MKQPATIQERILVVLLRLGGVLTLSAFAAMLLPPSWMAASHRWLGLGEFPAAPLTDYLARSVSALYGVHGGLLLVVSTNVRRYRPLVIYLGAMNVVLGVAMLAIDLHAPMPWWWTAGEGPPLVAMGLTLLYLVRSVPPAREREA